MKIVLISPFYPLRGGIAQFADELSEELEKDHEVLRVSYKRQYPTFLFPGKTQYVEPIDESKKKATPILDSVGLLSWFRLRSFLKKEKADVIISAYWMPFMIPGLWLSTMGLQTKKYALVHNYQSHEGKRLEQVITNFYLKKMDGIIALSDLVKTQISARLSVPVKSIAHPTYCQFGKPLESSKSRELLGIPKDKKVILFFGLIRAYKGLDVLLKAFNLLPEDYFLLIAGEAYGKTDEWNKDLAQLKNQNYLWHNRFIADEEVGSYFSAADVCVLPYKSATQSGVTAVAHHFGLPVIATDVGGLRESIQSGENGDLVEANNPAQMAQSIQLYFDENKREKYSKVLQDEGGLSWSDFVKQLMDFLR